MVLGAIVEAHDPNADQPALALVEHEVVAETLDVLEQHVLPVRDHLFPVLAGGRIDRAFEQPEVPGAVVAEDEKAVHVAAAVVGQVVLDVLAPRRDEAKLAEGFVRIEHPLLGGHLAPGREHQERVGLGAGNTDEEALVGLVIDLDVVFDRRAEPVADQLEGAVGLVEQVVKRVWLSLAHARAAPTPSMRSASSSPVCRSLTRTS